MRLACLNGHTSWDLQVGCVWVHVRKPYLWRRMGAGYIKWLRAAKIDLGHY